MSYALLPWYFRLIIGAYWALVIAAIGIFQP
jgi:hypothetical protein